MAEPEKVDPSLVEQMPHDSYYMYEGPGILTYAFGLAYLVFWIWMAVDAYRRYGGFNYWHPILFGTRIGVEGGYAYFCVRR